MAAPLISIHPFLPILETGGQILTPNNRLRNKLMQAYAYYRQNQPDYNENINWPAPAIYNLSDWLLEHYEAQLLEGKIQTPGILVSASQRQQLWRQIVEADNLGAELINPARLATDADSAYRNLELWQLDIDNIAGIEILDENSALASEPSIFQRWATQFRQQLNSLDLITREQLQANINQALSSSVLKLNGSIGLYGFDDIPPLTQATFSSFQSEPHVISSRQLKHSEVTRAEYASFEEEVKAAARWSQSQLQANPQAVIGIIVPNLGQSRETLERHFTEVFEPHFILPETERFTLPFNFSAGVPLASTPFIFDTLQLLRLPNHDWDTDNLCSLLYSPFYGEEQDSEFIAQLCHSLRDQGREKISASLLRHLCDKLNSKLDKQAGNQRAHAPFAHWLSQALQGIENNRRQTHGLQSASRWADFFLKQLNQLSWPGSRRLDSNEYQQMQQWLTLLEDFSKLDTINCQLSLHQALDQLTQMAATTHFQAQTPESPIQVLGALEGSGLQFSHCWVLGLNHKQWPPSPQPNPLLPLDLQRKARMPHADAERELHYAQQLTENYRHCASVVRFSSACHDDESPLQPSPLITDIALINDELPAQHVINTTPSLSDYQDTIVSSTQLEWLQVASAPAIDDAEKQHLSGGSSILRNQAICPFAAFAIHRLGARQPMAPTQGLSPIDRGHILHNSLASLWLELKSQAKLLALSEEQQLSMIEDHVRDAIAPFQQRTPDLLGPHYLKLETDRQTQLINLWLNQERERPAFTAQAVEEALKVDFHGLPLTMRLDRLDQLDSGELIVIDYKTGSPSINQWQGDQPEEPQLPLYALCYSADVHALMFAEINARQIRPVGLGELSSPHEGIVTPANSKLDLPDNWQDTCTYWDSALTQLTQDFLEGEALCEFKSPQLMRYYADLLPLMRLTEQERLRQLFNTAGGSIINASTLQTEITEGVKI